MALGEANDGLGEIVSFIASTPELAWVLFDPRVDDLSNFTAVPGVSKMYSKSRSRCGNRLCFIQRESINLSSGAAGSLVLRGCSEMIRFAEETSSSPLFLVALLTAEVTSFVAPRMLV